MLWLPGRTAGGHRVDLAIDFTGARATEKGEIEEMGQTFRVYFGITGGCEKIREWESLEFALVSFPTEPPVREDERRYPAHQRLIGRLPGLVDDYAPGPVGGAAPEV